MQAMVASRRATPVIDMQMPAMVSLAALIAAVTTVPLVVMIAGPIQGLVSGAYGASASALGLSLTLIGPFGYVIFAAIAWTILRERSDAARFGRTMTCAAYGLVPYVVLTLTGIGWQGGPRLPLIVAAALTLPMAVVATIWASARTD